MNTSSVQVIVQSNNPVNPIVVVPNELQIVTPDSTETLEDLLSKLSPKSPLLTHILTYIQCQSLSKPSTDGRNNTNFPNYSKFIAIFGVIFDPNSNGTKCQISNAKEKIAHLATRHRFDQIVFEISHSLVAQSSIFLHSMGNMDNGTVITRNGIGSPDPRSIVKNYNANFNVITSNNRVSKGNGIAVGNQNEYYPFSPYAKHKPKVLNPNVNNINLNNNNFISPNFNRGRQC